VPTVDWSAANQAVSESAGSLTVTARLSATLDTAVTIPFTVSGTAQAPGDYSMAAGPITIPRDP